MNMGKWLMILGLGIVVVGALFWIGSKIGISFGKLPGDIQVHKEKISFHFPIVTSIVISIVLTALLNLFFWLFRK